MRTVRARLTGDLDPELQQSYERTYQAGLSDWRWIGAIGKARNVMELCRTIPHRKVLEIGAGEGALLKRLQDDGFAEEAFAVEISDEAARLIRTRDIPRLVELKVYDGGRIPYADGTFDLALLSHVVEHLEHPRKVLYEAARVARYVFVEVPVEDTFRRRGDFKPEATGHINFYSPKSIRWLVQTCGFRIVRQVVVNPPRSGYRFQRGWRGVVDHFSKEVLLRSLRGLAPFLTWKYHCALLCESPSRPGPGALHRDGAEKVRTSRAGPRR